MVVAGGIAQALMLPLIGIAAVYLRHTSAAGRHPAIGADDARALGFNGRDGVGGGVLRGRRWRHEPQLTPDYCPFKTTSPNRFMPDPPLEPAS